MVEHIAESWALPADAPPFSGTTPAIPHIS
jgi:hypothetical protein